MNSTNIFPVGWEGGRSLRLMHVAVEDAGRYTCVVSNSAGEERKNFDLDILGKQATPHHINDKYIMLIKGVVHPLIYFCLLITHALDT